MSVILETGILGLFLKGLYSYKIMNVDDNQSVKSLKALVVLFITVTFIMSLLKLLKILIYALAGKHEHCTMSISHIINNSTKIASYVVMSVLLYNAYGRDLNLKMSQLTATMIFVFTMQIVELLLGIYNSC